MSTLSRFCKDHPGRALALLLLITAVLYYPALRYDFIFMLDDGFYVTSNRFIVPSWSNFVHLLKTPVLGLHTPIPSASYMLDYALGGKNPFFFHLQSILLHLAGVALVFSLFRKLRISGAAAFFLALFYAIHPQRIESVVWISERKDMWMAIFFWSSTLLYLSGGAKGRIGAFLCMFGTLLCKPIGIFLPVIFYLLDTIRLRRWKRSRSECLMLVPYCALSIFFLLWRAALVAGGATNLAKGGIQWGIFLRNGFLYPGKMLLPLDLAPIYPYTAFTPLFIAGLVAAAFVTAGGLLWAWRRWPKRMLYRVLPPLLGMYALLSLVMGIFLFSNAEFADRYSLLPHVFFLLLIGLNLRWIRRRSLRLLLACGYAGMLFCLSFWYMPVWENSNTLYSYSCDTPSPNRQALFSYAAMKFADNDVDQAIEIISHPRVANYEPAVILRTFFTGMRNQDMALLRKIDTPDGHKVLLTIKLNLRIQLGTALGNDALRRGDPEGAILHFDQLRADCAEDPFFEAFYAGMVAFLRKDRAEAERQWKIALKYEPNDEILLLNLERLRKP